MIHIPDTIAVQPEHKKCGLNRICEMAFYSLSFLMLNHIDSIAFETDEFEMNGKPWVCFNVYNQWYFFIFSCSVVLIITVYFSVRISCIFYVIVTQMNSIVLYNQTENGTNIGNHLLKCLFFIKILDKNNFYSNSLMFHCFHFHHFFFHWVIIDWWKIATCVDSYDFSTFYVKWKIHIIHM